MKQYTTPQVRELGSITELTQGPFNKIGGGQDSLSTQQNQLVGSIIPINP
jgi:hypothetical protein